MATYKARICAGNGYTSQEVFVDGVQSSSSAKARLRAMYPGANISSSASFVDEYDMGRRAEVERRQREEKERHAEVQRQRDEQDRKMKEANSWDNDTTSYSSSTTSSSSYSSSSSSGDGITLEGLLALAALGIGGFAAFVAIMTLWVFLPELLLGVGAFAAFKGGKAINNRGFQRNTKIGMITTLAVISTVLPYLGGMEAHKAVEFDRNSYIEEVKQDWKEFNS